LVGPSPVSPGRGFEGIMFIRQDHRVSLFPFVQYQIGLRLGEGLVPFSLKYLEGECGNKS
jgi:hypothetical protein